MINFDDYTNENIIEHNSKCPYTPDHPYRILVIGGSGSGKTDALLNLINNQPDIDKIYLYAKDPYEKKYQYLINKREKVGLNHFNDPKAFMEYSNDMQDVYKNIEDYNPIKKRKILIVFDDMIADMISNNKLNLIVTELFIRGRKLNISVVFITQSYFKVPKDVRLNSTHFFIMKIPNKTELQQIALNHSSDIDFKDFMNIYKKYTKEPYSFLVNDTTLPSDDPLRFRKNLLGALESFNRETAKISALSSGKIDKYEYLTGEEILPSNQQQIIQQAKFTYSPLGKALKKQRKTIEDQGEKQVDALKTSYKKLPSMKDFVPIEKFNREIIAEIKRIGEIEKNVDRDKMVYESTSRNYDFRGFKTIRTYGNDIRNNVISLKAANLEQANLMVHVQNFVKNTKPQDPEQKK